MRGVIISNGTIKNLNLLTLNLKENDYIVCADGGANYIKRMNIYPNVIMGDLDSINSQVLGYAKKSNIPIIKFPSHKDKTDTELAIDHLIEKGCNEILLMGVTGSRLDHTLGNITLLYKLMNKGIKGRIIDDNNVVYIVKDRIKLYNKRGSYVSIIPLTDNGAVVSLEGFEYRLNSYHIDFASTLGISNRILGKEAFVEIEKGVCLIIESRD